MVILSETILTKGVTLKVDRQQINQLEALPKCQRLPIAIYVQSKVANCVYASLH